MFVRRTENALNGKFDEVSLRWWQNSRRFGDDPEKFSAFLQPYC